MLQLKYGLVYVLILACVVSLISCDGSQKEKKEEPVTDNDFITISPDYNRYFQTSEGKTWIPVMINYIMPDGEEREVFKSVDRYFKSFSEVGGNAVRIWISSPFLEIEDKQMGAYSQNKLARIDTLLAIAKRYNIRIKFTLQHIRSISAESEDNNRWSNSDVLAVKNGQGFNNILEYITTPEGKAAYLNRVEVLADRYRMNPQIFCWELWNEMDAVDGAKWLPFTSEILDSVKMLFPHQLVVQTLGSLHSIDAEHRYLDLFQLPNNEYLNVHRYLDPGSAWGQYDQVRQPADLIASTAVQFAYEKGAQLPVLMNEVGAVQGNHTGPSELYAKDTLGVLLHDMVYAPYFSGAAGCGAMWHWNVYLDRQNLWWHYQRLTEVITLFDPVAEQFDPFYATRDDLRIYGLKGKQHTLLWCRDGRNSWQSELVEELKPKPREGVTLTLADIQVAEKQIVKTYDPWKGVWTKIFVTDGEITLPQFSRSLIVVLEHGSIN
ncbi:hypothetical protein ACRTDU_16135 [Sunxiuqinia elliptica]